MKKQNELNDYFFFDRFLGFVERYDEVQQTNIMPTAEKWVEEKDFDAIYYYLALSHPNDMVCISHIKLANMSEEELLVLQDFSRSMAPLLDEQKVLCAELASYWKKFID